VACKIFSWWYYLSPMAQVKLLDFWAPWCGPCKIMDPVIEEIEKELGDKLEVVRINVDEDKEGLSQQYGVMSIPNYVVLKDGKEVGRKVGITAKSELIKLLSA
jgi:thioredoxin 1